MKKILYLVPLAIVALLLGLIATHPAPAKADTVVPLNPWVKVGGNITQQTANTPIKLTGIPTGTVLCLTSGGVLTTTGCTGGGSGSSGLASSTASGAWTPGNVAVVYSNGALYAIATSSWAATNGTLTITGTPGALVGGTNSSIALNLANANNWTALQHFTQASSTLFSVEGTAYFGGTATTTITSDGYIHGQTGAVGTPSVVVNGNAGIYGAGSNILGLAAGGSGLSFDGSSFTPNTDNVRYLGTPAKRWLFLNATNGLFTNASTTNATTTGSTYLTGITASKILQVDANGKVIPLTVGTGLSFDGTTLSASGGSGITAIGPTGQTQSGSTITIASSTGSFNGLTLGNTIVGSGNTLTWTPSISGTLAEGGGGTNQSTYTKGDVLYASAANTLSKLPIGTGGFVLASANGVPTWVATSTINNGVQSITVPQGTFNGALTFATTSNTTNGITSKLMITGSGSTLTFSSDQSGTLTVAGGGTGVGTLTGVAIGNGTSAFTAGSAQTCTNQFVRAMSASYVATCATVGAADVSLANLTATDASLTFSGTYNGSTARTIGLNVGNANTWTALQKFSNASSTLFSVNNTFYAGGTATTTIDSAGNTTIGGTLTSTAGLNKFGNASTSLQSITNKLYVGGTATTTIDSIGSITTPANSVLTLGTTTAGTLKTSASGVVYADTSSGGALATTTNIGDFPAYQIGMHDTITNTTGTSTFTVPSGISKVKVWICAGGGGGGGRSGTAISAAGGGGGCAYKVVDLTGTTTIQYHVGAGGAGGPTSSSGGVQGEWSTFGTNGFYFSCTGGGGGAINFGGGGGGGSCSGGDFNVSGTVGGGSWTATGINIGGGHPAGGVGGIFPGCGMGGEGTNGSGSATGNAGRDGCVWIQY